MKHLTLPAEVKLDLFMLSYAEMYCWSGNSSWYNNHDVIRQIRMKAGRLIWIPADKSEFKVADGEVTYSHAHYFAHVDGNIQTVYLPLFNCDQRTELLTFIKGFVGSSVKGQFSDALAALAQNHGSEAVRRKCLSLLKELKFADS